MLDKAFIYVSFRFSQVNQMFQIWLQSTRLSLRRRRTTWRKQSDDLCLIQKGKRDVVWQWVSANLPVLATQLLACQSHPQTISGGYRVTTPVSVEQTWWNPPCLTTKTLPRCFTSILSSLFSHPPTSGSVIPLAALPGHCPTTSAETGQPRTKSATTIKRPSGLNESPLATCAPSQSGI